MCGDRDRLCGWLRNASSSHGVALSSEGGSCPPSSEASRMSAPIFLTRRIGTGSCIPASIRICSPTSTGGKMPGSATLARAACQSNPRSSSTPARVARSIATIAKGVVRSSKRKSPHCSRSIRFNPLLEKIEVRGRLHWTIWRWISRKISSLSAKDLPIRCIPGAIIPLLHAAI